MRMHCTASHLHDTFHTHTFISFHLLPQWVNCKVLHWRLHRVPLRPWSLLWPLYFGLFPLWARSVKPTWAVNSAQWPFSEQSYSLSFFPFFLYLAQLTPYLRLTSMPLNVFQTRKLPSGSNKMTTWSLETLSISVMKFTLMDFTMQSCLPCLPDVFQTNRTIFYSSLPN